MSQSHDSETGLLITKTVFTGKVRYTGGQSGHKANRSEREKAKARFRKKPSRDQKCQERNLGKKRLNFDLLSSVNPVCYISVWKM